MISLTPSLADRRTETNYDYIQSKRSSDGLSIRLPTLIGLSPMLGHRLDDRNTIAKSQDCFLAMRLVRESGYPLPERVRPQDFFVAPLDILPYRHEGRLQFQLLELNGTGIGGVTNMPEPLVLDILDTIAEIGNLSNGSAPLIVVASSGRELAENLKPSHLLHEKFLFVDQIAAALERRFGDCEILCLDQLVARGGWNDPSRPAVLLGYSRELVQQSCVCEGVPRLYGRDASAVVNDRFLFNLRAARGALDSRAFLAANSCYAVGADKAEAYRHVNSFVAENFLFSRDRSKGMESFIRYDVCDDYDSLLQKVLSRLSRGERLVIKPSGTGHGDGIEFFLCNENKDVVADRIGGSIATVAERYGCGAGFPYTVAEYLDAEVIRDERHPLRGRKFELRVVVYRKGRMLHAVPSIAKVAPEKWDPAHPTRGALINNISAAVRSGKTAGASQALPLCQAETMQALGLDEGILSEICCWASSYVAHVLAETHSELAGPQ
jgi:hypothetical protein